MTFEALIQHRSKFQVGKPTPYGIFDASGRLLLASGQMIRDDDQLLGLIDRNATVDLREFNDGCRRISQARTDQLPGFWHDTLDALGRVLRAQVGGDFIKSLDKAAQPLLALIARDPDLAILQVVGGLGGADQGQYASRHAVHTATAACLAAQRLGWDEAQSKCVLRVALTMNLAMAELQNRLVNQVTPVTTMQRGEIQSHPERSAHLLEKMGVEDATWVEAVRQHHELDGGKGYPRGLGEVHEVAKLVQRCDNFTAKLSARAARPALLADRAVRLQFQAGAADPITAALIKEFGLYPPGCMVRLKSGETGMVMRRGATAHAPMVAVIVDRAGDAMLAPVRRDTSKAEYAILALMPAAALRVNVGLEKLLACMPI